MQIQGCVDHSLPLLYWKLRIRLSLLEVETLDAREGLLEEKLGEPFLVACLFGTRTLV